MKRMQRSRLIRAIGVVWLASIGAAYAQGVTTAAVTGVVLDQQGGVLPGTSVTAVHQPSGTTYEAVTQGDGRFFIPGVRVGGPYKVSAALTLYGPPTLMPGMKNLPSPCVTAS